MVSSQRSHSSIPFKRFLTTLGVVAAIVFLVGIVGFFGLTARNPLSLIKTGAQGSPGAALFVPRQAPLMVSLLVKPEQLSRLRQMVAPANGRAAAQRELQQIERTLLADTGLTYAADLAPWLGTEITLALTSADIDRTADNGAQPGIMLALAAEDGDRAREFVQLFWQKRAIAGAKLVFEQYAGVQLIYGQASAASTAADRPWLDTVATAVVGNRYLIFANDPTVLRQVITTAQAPDLNLARNSTYQRALSTLPDNRVGLVYANFPQLATWLGVGTESARFTDPLRGIASLRLDRRGIVADLALAPGATHHQPHSPSPDILAQLPETVGAAIAGHDLAQTWQALLSALGNYPTLTAALDRQTGTLGLDTLNQVLDWVQGDYALGLWPQPDRSLDWLLLAKSSPPDAPSASDLDQLAQARGLSVGPFPLGEKTVQAWTRLSTQDRRSGRNAQDFTLSTTVVGLRTELGDYQVLASSVATLAAVMAPGQPLTDSSRFQHISQPLPTPNDGTGYLDWDAMAPALGQRFPALALADRTAQPILRHLSGLALSRSASQSGLDRGTLVIRLKP